jgi:hypothetical protein
MYYFHLTEEDKKILKDTFKIPISQWGNYDRFLDGIWGGMDRESKIRDNYGLPPLNNDALYTIVKLHGYAFESIEDHIIYPKKKVKK